MMIETSENDRRKERAFRTVLVYSQYVGEGENIESGITDLMTDLLHLCDDYSDAETIHALVWRHYVAEREE